MMLSSSPPSTETNAVCSPTPAFSRVSSLRMLPWMTSVRLSRPGRAGGFWLENSTRGPDTAVQFSNDLRFPFRADTQSKVRITFVIQGEQFAIFADGQPIYYSTLSGERKLNLETIEFSLLTDSSANPIEIHWDNLKIWDLNR